jgi:SAM-dependent methyltransferase
MTLKDNLLNYEINRRRELLKTDTLNHGSVAVDVGTGDGFSALALLCVSDLVIAIDKDWTHLTEYALPRIAGKQAVLVQADFIHLPVHPIDLYCSFDSWRQALLHQSSTEKLEKTVKEAFKCLKPGGTLLCVERLAFFDNWQPQNQFQKNRKVYYTIVEHLFDPPIFKKIVLSIEEFLSIVGQHFEICTLEKVYERVILKDAFFDYVKKRNLRIEDQRHVEFLTENPKIEDPMLRLVGRKKS